MRSFLNPPNQAPRNKPLASASAAANRITVSYVSALLLIALLSLFSYAALNDATISQRRIAVLINTAARQGTLSQKIALLSVQLVDLPPGDAKEGLRAQLLDYAAEMGTAHTRLADENSATNLSGRTPSPEIRALYFDPPFALDSHVTAYLSAVRALAETPDPQPDDMHLAYITNNAPDLLIRLDTVVARYTSESILDTNMLERREGLTFISIITLLVIVGWFIFRPLERRIREEHHNLLNQIDERKQIEINHAQMAAIIQSSNESIIGKTLEGVITSWNFGAEQLYGYKTEETVGKSISILMPPDEFDELPYILKTLQQGDRIENYETVRIHKNGQRVNVSLTISPIQDSMGKVIGASTISHDITERKRAEAAVQRSEMLYRTLVRNLPDMAVILYDRDFRYLLAEGEFLEKTGYSKEQLEGKYLHDVLPSPAREVIESYLQAAFNGEMPEFERSTGDLTYKGWIVPVTGLSEGITGAMFVIQDITQSRLAEKVLRESETRFRTLVTYSPVGIIQTDANGNCTFVNQRWSEIAGFSESDALGSGWTQALYPEDRELVFGFWLATAFTEQDFNLEYRFQQPDGQIAWVLGSAIALRDDAGEVTGYFGTVTDMTDRKAIEAQLSDREERFRQLAENISHVFWMFKPDFSELLYISPAYEVIWGRSCESMYQNPSSFLQAVPAEDRAKILTERAEKMMSGHYDVEHRVIRPDGSSRWVHSRAFPVINENGEIYRIAGISEDITDRKRVEQQAVELRVEKEKVQMLSDFITNTSHELRTPLSTITTSVYLAQKQTETAKQKRYFEMIEARVWQLNRLIDQLHLMTKLDNETLLEMSPIQVNQIIEILNETLKSQAIIKHIQITLELQPQLPPIAAHYDYMYHAIENLIENAILYTPENGSIIVRTRPLDDTICIEIRDTGIGIKPDDINRIFTRFYKVNEARTGNSSGAGLGLTMVKRIIELHQGEIEVESTLSQGTIFRIFLPIHQPTHQSLPGF